MVAYNSKVFYVITEGAGLGDNVRRVPITGNETVLDAISAGQRPVAGVEQADLDRAARAGRFGCEQILPVDYEAISRGGSAATNYQIMPGDRVFIAEDRSWPRRTSWQNDGPGRAAVGHHRPGHLDRPQSQTMGRSYNQFRSGSCP